MGLVGAGMANLQLLRAGAPIKSGDVLAFLAVGNEALGLPAGLEHQRRLDVDQFSLSSTTPPTTATGSLAAMPDVRLYRGRYWALMIDADELR